MYIQKYQLQMTLFPPQIPCTILVINNVTGIILNMSVVNVAFIFVVSHIISKQQ